MLGSADWWLITDAAVQPFSPIFQDLADQEKPIDCSETSVTTNGLLEL